MQGRKSGGVLVAIEVGRPIASGEMHVDNFRHTTRRPHVP